MTNAQRWNLQHGKKTPNWFYDDQETDAEDSLLDRYIIKMVETRDKRRALLDLKQMPEIEKEIEKQIEKQVEKALDEVIKKLNK